MDKCFAKHTKYQPSDDDWVCPKCGADSSSFVINDHAEGASEDCGKLHVQDNVECFSCGYGGSGRSVSSLMAKTANLVICSCCNGAGYVKQEAEK